MRANLLCLGLFGVVMFCVIAAFFVTNRQWLQVRREQQGDHRAVHKEGAKIDQLNTLKTQKAEMLEKAEITTALIEKVPRSRLLTELVNRMPQDITLLELSLVSKRLKDTPPPASPGSSQPAIKTLAPTGASTTAGPRRPGTPAPASKDASKPAPPERPQAPRFEYTLHLTGVAKVNTSIADYISALKACSFLDGVDLKYIKETMIDKLELRKFELEATIKKDADARDIATPNELQSAGAIGADPARSTDGEPEPSAAKPENIKVIVKPLSAETGKKPGGE
jgi:Tfp pilus assembly protein PilN